MLYQIMVRASGDTAWEPYGTPADEPFATMRLIQAANQAYGEVTILQAEDAPALTGLIRRVARGELPAPGVSPVPGLTPMPRVTVHDVPYDRQRWDLEQGAGGDHDAPYAFALPDSLEVISAWLRLLARRWREQHGGAAA